jgi:hypothetical protein
MILRWGGGREVRHGPGIQQLIQSRGRLQGVADRTPPGTGQAGQRRVQLTLAPGNLDRHASVLVDHDAAHVLAG